MGHLRDLVSTYPNWITLFRIACVPVIPFCISSRLYTAAFISFLFLAWTDWFDGYLARKYNQSTPIGRVLDPLADKLLVWVTLWTFSYETIVFWMVFILFAIDILLMAFGAYAFEMFRVGRVRSEAVGANRFGKLKFFLQILFVVSLFLIDVNLADVISRRIYVFFPFITLLFAIFCAVGSLAKHVHSFRRARRPILMRVA
jgi:CDP-diacylglycerol--glycerol-3-phosphate 3-phosphatidyltransferase